MTMALQSNPRPRALQPWHAEKKRQKLTVVATLGFSGVLSPSLTLLLVMVVVAFVVATIQE
jgi:hypothetical protein